MTIVILYFAKARDLAGTSREALDVDGSVGRLADLLPLLTERHPPLAGAIERMRIARNESFAELDEPVEDGDVIAVIPPVAGG